MSIQQIPALKYEKALIYSSFKQSHHNDLISYLEIIYLFSFAPSPLDHLDIHKDIITL